ncbi:hypothetical protein [Serratia liquefaciens]|uniref:hypothetical protein n=1 Tax=Serratia liquefaciens TaxID=614 RepID=UPI0023607E30|nr:hypothetical protein [Serratia liquefaciens]
MGKRYNTGNQRPSNSMKDLNDNALAYDDFLNSDEDEAVDRFQQPFPTVRKQVSARINEIIGAQQDAEEYAKEAKQYADDAKNIIDANTYHITQGDPDGTIAGLAGTESGKYFQVGQGPGMGFKYYLNDSGVAIEVSESVGSAAIEQVLNQLQNSEIGPEVAFTDAVGRTHTYIQNGDITTKKLKLIGSDGQDVWLSDDFGRRIALARKHNGIMRTEADGLATNTITIEPNDSERLEMGDEFGRRKIIGSSGSQPPDTSTWLKDAVQRMEVVALQSRERVMTRGNNIARLIAEYIIFLFTGQSISSGTESFPSLSKTQPTDSKMLGDSVMPESPTKPAFVPRGGAALKPLIATCCDADGNALTDEDVAQVEPGTIVYGESPAVAAVNGLRRLYLDGISKPADPDKIFIAAASGVGGRTAAQLSKGATPNLYQRNVDAMNIVKGIADTDGKTFQVGAFNDKQGENDYPNTPKQEFKDIKNKYYDDLQGDRPANPDGRNTAIFITQTGASYTRDENHLSIGMAQLELSNERDDVFMIGGYYPYTNKVSGHLDSNGARNLGDKEAEIKYRVLVLGQDWKPMQPLQAVHHERDAIIALHAPVVPLQFAAPYVGSVTQTWADKGLTAFDKVDGALSVIGIISVERAATSCVHVKLEREPVGNLVFRYADKNFHGGNGMICDSSNGLSPVKYTYLPNSGMYPEANIPALVDKPYDRRNWCVAFEITAEKE